MAVFWCRFEEDDTGRGHVLPAFFFDRSYCESLAIRTEPSVHCEGLIALKALLDSAVGDSVVENQHSGLEIGRNADATGSSELSPTDERVRTSNLRLRSSAAVLNRRREI